MHTRTLKTAIVLIMVMIVSVIALPESVRADAVTDNISVAIGYSGMQLSEYVEVGDYHWSELANALPTYEQAYSYYQGDGGPEFTEIVDAGRGFLLIDLLNYANVYYDDIYNLQFYVIDHQGIQAAFDRDVLFANRYYFEDYNGHLSREYDEDFNLISVDSTDCWNNCEIVDPMMALEDNWVAYTQEFEHSLPDFEHANTSSRFRLLFGQTEPEETLTSSSAKYVRTIYVTLWGQPEFGDLPELDGDYGAHQATMTTSVKSDMRSALSSLINMSSTDENVLLIKGVTMEQDDFYTDLVHITVDYEIVGEGSASIVASFGSSGQEIAATAAVTTGPDPGSGGSEPQEGGEEPAGQSDSDESKSKKDEGSGGKGDKSGESQDSGKKSGSGKSEAGSNKENKSLSEGQKQARTNTVSKKNQKASSTTPSGTASTASIFMLSEDVQKRLRGEKGDSASKSSVSSDADVTQVKIEDKTKEKEEQEKRILLFTGLGSIAVVALGGLWETLSFSVRLKKGI